MSARYRIEMDCVSSADKAEVLDVEALSALLCFLSEHQCIINALRWNQNDSATLARHEAPESDSSVSVHRLTLAFNTTTPSPDFEAAIKSQCQKYWRCEHLELSQA